MTQIKFPGLKCMTLDEVRVMAKVCKSEGDSPEKTLEIINCVDDCLVILKEMAIINSFRGKRKWNRYSARDIIADRVLRSNI